MVISEQLKSRFKDHITGRCGLYFKDHDLKSLEHALTSRMEDTHISSPEEYYSCLVVSAKKEEEFRELVNLLTIKHTYFFRHEPQFKALREKVLPEILAKKKKEAAGGNPMPVRIWSAGCSTGEEPYSIAMTVRDAMRLSGRFDVEILATDTSTEALDKARGAVYGHNAMKLVDDLCRNIYFSHVKVSGEDMFELKREVKDMVKFDYLNLMDENYPPCFDIIFCRNVTIYFDMETTISVINKLYTSLNGGGYLFQGYSESLQFMKGKFRMVDWEDAIYYCKGDVVKTDAVRAPASVREEADKILDELSKAELAAEIKTGAQNVVISKNLESLLTLIIKAIYAKQYDKALFLINEAKGLDSDAVDPYYLAAQVYAGQGRTEDAKHEIGILLRKSPFFVPGYYLLGSIFMEENDLEKAEENLKKALYLNGDFVLAQFSLATVSREQGRTDEAIRGYRNTLKLLSRYSPEDIVAYSGGFSVASLISVCKSSIERLKIGIA